MASTSTSGSVIPQAAGPSAGLYGGLTSRCAGVFAALALLVGCGDTATDADSSALPPALAAASERLDDAGFGVQILNVGPLDATSVVVDATGAEPVLLTTKLAYRQMPLVLIDVEGADDFKISLSFECGRYVVAGQSQKRNDEIVRVSKVCEGGSAG